MGKGKARNDASFVVKIDADTIRFCFRTDEAKVSRALSSVTS